MKNLLEWWSELDYGFKVVMTAFVIGISCIILMGIWLNTIVQETEKQYNIEVNICQKTCVLLYNENEITKYELHKCKEDCR